MKLQKKKKDRKYYLYLTCQECDHQFRSERFKKYCSYKCQRVASNRFAKTRYAEMRDIVLKSRGMIK